MLSGIDLAPECSGVDCSIGLNDWMASGVTQSSGTARFLRVLDSLRKDLARVSAVYLGGFFFAKELLTSLGWLQFQQQARLKAPCGPLALHPHYYSYHHSR